MHGITSQTIYFIVVTSSHKTWFCFIFMKTVRFLMVHIKVKVKVPILVVERIPVSEAVSLQVTAWIVMNLVVGCHQLPLRLTATHMHIINPAVGCHYFPPGPQLPSQPSDITALRPVPSYTAWWQRHIGVKNLPQYLRHGAWPRLEPTTSWSRVRYSTATSPKNDLQN